MHNQARARSTASVYTKLCRLGAIAVCLIGPTGCTGTLEGERRPTGSGPTAGGAAAGTSDTAGTTGSAAAPLDGPGRVVMHRLTPREYDNTVRDLLGTSQRLSDNFPPDYAAYGFDNVASTLNMTDATLAYFSDAARRIAAEALSTERRDSVVACDLGTGQSACVATVLSAFLPRAWRRPVTAADVDPLVALFAANKADGATDDEALGRTLEGALMAPEFLYRVEHNSGVAGVRALTGYELASRLSYFLWSSMPDAELTAAAASGALSEAAGLASQVARLLADSKGKTLAESFGSQWLPVRALDNVHPDSTVYPGFDDELRAAMRAETMRFFQDVASGSRSLQELLTSTSGYVNDRLARHYGLPAVGSSEPVFTPLPNGRSGLFAQAGFLTVLSYPNESNPVRRGKWILGQLLCQEPPPPPPNVPKEPAPQQGTSRRERLKAHRSEPICSSCHALMDPLGLALEQYDGIGAYRTTDSGAPIDPAGALADGRTFTTPAELARIIASDPALPKCVARQAFVYGLGRAPRDGSGFDSLALDGISETFNASGQLFPKLVEAIVLSDVFRKREDEAAAP